MSLCGVAVVAVVCQGHEDLRQDERVMQLFGLVNALLAKDRRTNKHDLSIQRCVSMVEGRTRARIDGLMCYLFRRPAPELTRHRGGVAGTV